MIYLCSKEKSEQAKYYARTKIGPVSIYRNYLFKDIGNLLTNNPLFPPCNVVLLKDNKPPKIKTKITTPIFNNTFLCVDKLNDWKVFTECKVFDVEPEKFIDFLPLLRGIMEPQAYNWLVDRFKKFPGKLEMELMFLTSEYKQRGELSFDFIYSRYGVIKNFNLVNSIRKHQLGDPLLTKKIIESSESELWSAFIGTEKRPPYVYYILKNNNRWDLIRLLDILRLEIEDGSISLKPGLVLLANKIRELK